jgi:DNA-binding transcriptional MerR regulator
MRIGEVAERTGLTTRTIRYYEQIGLLPPDQSRVKGRHRQYDATDVEQLTLIRVLTSVMGCSLDEVRTVARPELTVAVSDVRWDVLESVADRLRTVEVAISTIDSLLQRVRSRYDELHELERVLEDRMAVVESRRVIGV